MYCRLKCTKNHFPFQPEAIIIILNHFYAIENRSSFYRVEKKL